MTATSALPADACTLEGPCGLCVTLTPAARAALAENLAAEASPAGEAYTEALKAMTRALDHQNRHQLANDSWGRGLRVGFELSLRRLVEFAPAGTSGTALDAAHAVLAEASDQS